MLSSSPFVNTLKIFFNDVLTFAPKSIYIYNIIAKVNAINMQKRNIRMNNDTEVSKAGEKVQKRFELSKPANKKVFAFRKILSAEWVKAGKSEDPDFVAALEHIIATHPRTKNL